MSGIRATSTRAVVAVAALSLLASAMWPSPSAAAFDLACPLPSTQPTAASDGLDMGIFVTDTAPTGAAAANLLGYLDQLTGGDRSKLAIHLFSHYRGAGALPPGVIEHESDVTWFADQGFRVELTVPYRVPLVALPDPAGYVSYVEAVVDRLGTRLEAIMVTNEVNIDFWEGPSDGIHPGAFDALIAGVPAARAAADDLDLDLEIGFKWAYRHPNLEAERIFWTAVGEQGGEAFTEAVDFVGVDLYAFDFYVGDNSFADYTLQALAEMRACFLPLAGIGGSTPLRITESGAPTLMWGDAGQAEAISQMIGTAHAHSQSLNVESWRQWGLYCGPTPPDASALFHCTGLLYEDGSPRPSFAVFAELVAGSGTTVTPTTPTVPTASAPPASVGSSERSPDDTEDSAVPDPAGRSFERDARADVAAPRYAG